jgi:hypothetical protein
VWTLRVQHNLVGTSLMIFCHVFIDAPENLPNSEHFPHW